MYTRDTWMLNILPPLIINHAFMHCKTAVLKQLTAVLLQPPKTVVMLAKCLVTTLRDYSYYKN